MSTQFHPTLRTCRAAATDIPDGGSPVTEPSPAQTPPAAAPPDNAPLPGSGAEEQTAPSTLPAAEPPSAAPEETVDFTLDTEPPSEEERPGENGQEENGQEENGQEENKEEKEYILELPDDLEVTDDFKAILKEHAKNSGLDGKAAGKYVSGVIKAMEEGERANVAKATAELRSEWGKDFNANMEEVKKFAAKISQKSGLTADDLAPLGSPKGFRLLFSLRQMVGEAPFIGGAAAPAADPPKEARRMLTDPSHKYFQAIQDPQHPLFHEANREYNNLVGYPS